MDVDIDFPTTTDVLDFLPNWVKASVVKGGVLTPHPCGVYPQAIPKDRLTGTAAIPYAEAEKLGYDKLDFLHLQVYDIFESREEIKALVNLEPNWDLLMIPSVVENLFQLSRHFETISKIKPKSIEELADVIALIRPGKRHLLDFYLRDRDNARKLLYLKDENGFAFKKSHAIAYSLVIQLQLHLSI